MEEKEIKPIRERVMQHKKLAELVKKYVLNIGESERGIFLFLIEESYKIGIGDGRLSNR